MSSVADKNGGRWRMSWSAVFICSALGVPLALALLVGGALSVPVVYAVLFVEGDVLIYLMVRAGRSARGVPQLPSPAGSPADGFVSPNKVDALTSLVRWASKGSDLSRRDVARRIAKILGSSSQGEETPASAEFSGALRTILHPYFSDLTVKSELVDIDEEKLFGNPPRSDRGSRNPGRERYLSSLEVVVSRLEGGEEA